jgi:DnaK suppressor protein
MQNRLTTSKDTDRQVIYAQDDARSRLIAERRKVIVAITLTPLVGSDFSNSDQESDYASLDQIRDVEFTHREALIQRLHLLDEALERLDLGVYGVCAECGTRIVEKRLALDPAAAFCIGCQATFERTN